MEENKPSEQTKIVYKKRSAWAAFFLSLCCPGLGQLYCGKLTKAVIFFIIPNSILLGLFFALIFTPFQFNIYFFIALISQFAFFIYVIYDAVWSSIKSDLNYKLKLYNKWYIYCIIFFITAFFIYPLDSSIYSETYSMPTESMNNTLFGGDYITVSKSAYGIHIPFSNKYLLKYEKPKTNQLIVIISPGTRDEIIPIEETFIPNA
jgi:TM2 domain-containing membrane protein YozV